jgi:hypothetical protein
MTMTIVEPARTVTGGVDTHLDVHVAAALDPVGGLLGTAPFRTTPAGYQDLLSWLESFGNVSKVGVEGTGSYGAGLSNFLRRADVVVIEVDRPNRANAGGWQVGSHRRRRGSPSCARRQCIVSKAKSFNSSRGWPGAHWLPAIRSFQQVS